MPYNVPVQNTVPQSIASGNQQYAQILAALLGYATGGQSDAPAYDSVYPGAGGQNYMSVPTAGGGGMSVPASNAGAYPGVAGGGYKPYTQPSNAGSSY